MKIKIKKCKIIRYLVLLVISIIPTLFTSISFYKINLDTSVDATAKTLEILGRRQLVSLVDWKQEFIFDLNAMTNLSCFQNFNSDDIARIIQFIKFYKPVYREIYVIDKEGNIYFGFVPNKKEFLNSLLVKNALSGIQNLSDVIKVNDKLYLDIAVPISKNDDVVGAICARIDLEYLNNLMKSIEKDETIESFIVDKNGLFLTESRYVPDAIGNLKVDIERIKTSIDYSITIPYKDYKNEMVYGRYFPINDTGWTLIVQKDADSIKKQNQSIIDIGKYTSIIQIIGLIILRKLKNEDIIEEYLADKVESELNNTNSSKE